MEVVWSNLTYHCAEPFCSIEQSINKQLLPNKNIHQKFCHGEKSHPVPAETLQPTAVTTALHAPQISPYWWITWVGWRPQCCCTFCSVSHDWGSQKHFQHHKNKVPNYLWCGSPQQQRDNRDIKLGSLFRDEHLTTAGGMRHLLQGQLCHQSQCHLLCVTWQWTDPPDSSASVPSCNSPHSHPPICSHNRRQSGKKRLIVSSGKAVLNANSLTCMGLHK